MAGRVFGRIGHGYGGAKFGAHLGSYYSVYSPSNIATRLLFHSALAPEHQLCVYPYVPDETTFFTFDVVGRRDVAFTKTLTGHAVSKWQRVLEDTIIKEIFRPVGGLAISWAFFHQLERIYLRDPDWDAGEFLIWRPFDRTWKCYSVDIVNLLMNGDEWGPEHAGWTGNQDHQAINEVQLWLKIRPEEAPQASLHMVGGSETPEFSLFSNNGEPTPEEEPPPED